MFGNYYNPLNDYHNMLRSSRMSGYPNVPMMSPHPYEMSAYSGVRQNNSNPYPFRYNQGAQMRLYLDPNAGGLANYMRGPWKHRRKRQYPAQQQQYTPSTIVPNYVPSRR